MIGGLSLAAVAVGRRGLLSSFSNVRRCACVHVDSVCVCKKGTLEKFALAWRELHASARSLNLSTGFSLDFEFVISFSKFLGTVILWTIFGEIVEENSFRRNILEDYIHKDNLLMIQRSIRDHTWELFKVFNWSERVESELEFVERLRWDNVSVILCSI